MQSQTNKAFFRPAAACEYLGVCRTKLHNLHESDPTFPRKIILSARCVGWTKDQLDNWLASKMEAANHG